MEEQRKTEEIEHYDRQAKGLGGGRVSANFQGFDPLNLASFRFCYKLLKENCQGKIVLDYGCGNGLHTIALVKMGAEKVLGIDLSEESLKIAKIRAQKEGIEGKVQFLKMDCEKMEFPDNYFDVIFDGGTFSSLDLNQALLELKRVLRPEGVLIGIETFGHNPIANLKRKLNKMTGKRTGWAKDHIFKEKDFKEAEKYFKEIKAWFFHPFSFLALPFLKLPGGKIVLKTFEAIDRAFLPFFKKYSFKTVFIFKNVR